MLSLGQDLDQFLMDSHKGQRICSTLLQEGRDPCLDHMEALEALTCPQALVYQVGLE